MGGKNYAYKLCLKRTVPVALRDAQRNALAPCDGPVSHAYKPPSMRRGARLALRRRRNLVEALMEASFWNPGSGYIRSLAIDAAVDDRFEQPPHHRYDKDETYNSHDREDECVSSEETSNRVRATSVIQGAPSRYHNRKYCLVCIGELPACTPPKYRVLYLKSMAKICLGLHFLHFFRNEQIVTTPTQSSS